MVILYCNNILSFIIKISFDKNISSIILLKEKKIDQNIKKIIEIKL